MEGGARLQECQYEDVVNQKGYLPRVNLSQYTRLSRIVVASKFTVLDLESVAPKGKMPNSGLLCVKYKSVPARNSLIERTFFSIRVCNDGAVNFIASESMTCTPECIASRRCWCWWTRPIRFVLLSYDPRGQPIETYWAARRSRSATISPPGTFRC